MRPTLSRAAFLGLVPSGLIPFVAPPVLEPSPPPALRLTNARVGPSGTAARRPDLTTAVPAVVVRHAPPLPEVGGGKSVDSDDYYAANPTVFGRILEGTLPCRALRETPTCLAFLDRTPRAPLHALVIPKRFVPSLFDVTAHNLPLLEELRAVGLELVRTHAPEAYAAGDYRLVCHVPPFNSVDHLHVHVLAPVSQMAPYYRFVKYADNTRWSLGFDRALRRLRSGLPAVPYRAPPAPPTWR